MREAERTLEVLSEISTNNQEYRFKRLYENLYNSDFYIRAYLKLAPHEGNMTRGTDGRTIDGFGKEAVESIIQRMKLEQFTPKPARRIYIPKKNGKLRPLGIGNFEDKIVQEVIREILEAIYEPIFKDSSHGFRPNRSCQTALQRIVCTSTGSAWAIEGDLSNFFGTIDHDLLIEILAKRIDDGRLLNLIRKFLKAGYLEEGKFEETTLGTPQGSVLSPILANIFLHEFANEVCMPSGEWIHVFLSVTDWTDHDKKEGWFFDSCTQSSILRYDKVFDFNAFWKGFGNTSSLEVTDYIHRYHEEHPKVFETEKNQMVKNYADIVAKLKSMGLTDEAIEYALKTPKTTLRRWAEKQGYEWRKWSMNHSYRFKKIYGEKQDASQAE